MGAIPQTAGLDLPGMVEAGKSGKLKALYVVGSNPVGRLEHRSVRVLEELSSSCRTCS